jgi:MinD-like ATPase involved in chromosome partitioning or flagellar assembly
VNFLRNFLIALSLILWLAPLGYAQLYQGDIVVIDDDAGTGSLGALFRVNPATGVRTLLSDFGAGANQGHEPSGIAVESSGNILVIDPWTDALFRVNPATGVRTLLSDFGAGSNQGVIPYGVAVESSGNILVIDPSAGTGGLGALFRVDPATGLRTLLSDFGTGSNQGVFPVGVAVESSGNILITDENAGTGGLGALFRVDPATGVRTLLSDFGTGSNQGVDPWGVAVESSGNILVIDEDAGTGGLGALFRVDPATGVRTLLSDFGTGSNQGHNPRGLAVESSGNILVADIDAGTGGLGALFRVDPATGVRTLLSDFGAGSNQGANPQGVAVYAPQSIPSIPSIASIPSINEWGMIIFMFLAGLGAVYYLKRQKRVEK